MNERVRLRAGFDGLAQLYDRSRPTYPDALFADLVASTGIGPGKRVLEIGCGTGQASVSLARTGCELLAVELGPQLAEIAAEHLAPYPAKVVVADFDRWTPAEAGFDLIFSATAFHWLDPATRYLRTADLLTPDGVLATVRTEHVLGGTEQFFRDVQHCYRRFDPQTTLDHGPMPADQLPVVTDLGLDGCYEQPEFRRHQWDVTYTTAEYLDVLRTYSSTFGMSAPTADGKLRCIGTLIDGRYGGRVTKRYLAELRVARVRSRGPHVRTP
jgi:SAM-dependent methyltransferase